MSRWGYFSVYIDNKESLLKLSEDYFTQIKDQVMSIVKEMDGHETHNNFNTEL